MTNTLHYARPEIKISDVGPWERFKDRDVRDPREALRVIYEHDTQEESKLMTLLSIRKLFYATPDMVNTLNQCQPDIDKLSKITVQSDEEWKRVASTMRDLKKKGLEESLREINFNLAAQTSNLTMFEPHHPWMQRPYESIVTGIAHYRSPKPFPKHFTMRSSGYFTDISE